MELKKIYCKHFPLPKFTALTVFPWVFIRDDKRKQYTDRVDRHETTHAYQQMETIWIFFFLIYGLEYLVKLLITFSHKKAYRSISFEQEAYANQGKVNYNNERKHYAWVKYIFKLMFVYLN